MRIYHYTTIDTLALILKNRTIRFNRLDNLDDLQECVKDKSGYNLGQYVFVSSWTDNPTERLALWKLYTQGVGVRISMDSDMFQRYIIVGDGKRITGNLMTLIPADDCMFSTKDYYVFPVMGKLIDNFVRKVKYVDDFEQRTSNLIEMNGQEFSYKFGEVGRYKSNIWAFQDEVRFVLNIYPKTEGINFLDSDVEMVPRCINSNQKLSINDYYMNLKDDAFDSLEVTLYPSCTKSHKIIVDSLLKEYAPHVKAKPSELEGKVRLK